jgi:plasmid stabilization system protein ParE
MRVEWTEQAKVGRKQVADYIRDRFGLRHKRDFIQEVNKAVNMLMRLPNVGSVESLLADYPRTYRSIVVNHLSKIVYRIDGDIIYIVAFWDVRRNPETLAKEVK